MNNIKTCIDRILPGEVNRPQRMMAFGDRQRAVFVFRKMWINGSTLRGRISAPTLPGFRKASRQ